MSKGQMPKMKGAICNVPVSVNDISLTLPRNLNSSGIILVKLKKKLEFNGHVYFEPVSPEKLKNALVYLKANNKFYEDVNININDLPPELLNFDENEEINIELQDDETDFETNANPLDSFRQGASESCAFPHSLTNEYIEIAPGEGKKPENIMLDKNCEELSFPHLLSKGKFGYQVERDVKLSPGKYFNQRLLNYKQTFASCSDYIFFVQFVLQQLKLQNQINIAVKMVSGNLTAGMLSRNFKQTVQSLISSDQCFLFMNCIKGTPAYWKRFQSEVLAMIRQLGCPTFFLTLSCADLQWNELIRIISTMNGKPLNNEDVERLTYFQRCKMLN